MSSYPSDLHITFKQHQGGYLIGMIAASGLHASQIQLCLYYIHYLKLKLNEI